MDLIHRVAIEARGYSSRMSAEMTSSLTAGLNDRVG